MTETAPMLRVKGKIAHVVKCLPHFVDQLYAGRKPFELRKMDRPYQVGDSIAMREWHPIQKKYGNRIYVARIGYILYAEEAPSGGLQHGFGILGLERIGRDEIADVREAIEAEAGR